MENDDLLYSILKYAKRNPTVELLLCLKKNDKSQNIANNFYL